MLRLAFQSPKMMFLRSFEEAQCPMCLKRTNSFVLMGLDFAPCLDCFYVFYIQDAQSLKKTKILEDK